MMDGIVTNAVYGVANVTLEGRNGVIDIICWDTDGNATAYDRLIVNLDEAKALWLALNEFIKAVENPPVRNGIYIRRNEQGE